MADVSFSNNPIDVSAIPQLADDDFVRVHKSFLRVSLIGRAIFAVGVIVVAIVVFMFSDNEMRLISTSVFAVLLVLTAISVVLKIFEVRNIAYQVREQDLSYRNGVIIKRVQTVPFVRVQHARMRQGPVERAFGLATLSISSAGPDIGIAGLGIDDAKRLRALVVERAGDLTEDQ